MSKLKVFIKRIFKIYNYLNQFLNEISLTYQKPSPLR